MKKLVTIIFILAIFTVLIFNTLAGKARNNPANPKVLIGGKTIFVEIADDPQERKLGLMKRESLAKDTGMLFIFESIQKVVFWMKDCNFTIDIIMMKDGKIVTIYHSVPPCKSFPCELYPSADLVNQVLEVNAGFAEKYNVKIGDTVEFKDLN